MHGSSYYLMEELLDRHVASPQGKTILDVGSLEVGGTYRKMCEDRGLSYAGCDISPGNNVDLVIPEQGDWNVGQFDVVISGQCLEHVKRPWEWIKQVYVAVKPGGVVIVIAPWQWEVHRHPVDCWRVLPDGMTSLLEYAGFDDVETAIPPKTPDCYGVATRLFPLEKAYRSARDTASDINEHVPRLRELAEQCEYVTEFGVREGVSTTALLAGSLKGSLQRLTSYDITDPPGVNRLKHLDDHGVFVFVRSCTGIKPIIKTDLLFIDSSHKYHHLKRELFANRSQVRRWIVIHDTELYGNCDEGTVSGIGLKPAIREFLEDQPEWFVSEHYTNNNGLTILSKNPADPRVDSKILR